jgi:GntR family transcriptional repressor for pyruvate dehydrogenase complex
MSVRDRALESLRELIADGTFQPGKRLPPEPELAVRLGVSRSTLRDAIRILQQTQAIEVRRGDGTYVVDRDPTRLLSGLSATLDLLDDDSVIEIFEVRRILESAATAKATSVITDSQLTELSEHLDWMDSIDDPQELIRADIEFHRRIVACAGSATLSGLLQGFSEVAFRVHVWRAISEAQALSVTSAQHRRILAAMSRRDPQLAAAEAAAHVATSEQWAAQLLQVRARGGSERGEAPRSSRRPRGAHG